MTNLKSTKRALMFSVMSLLLCFTMLLGTTFAWFTDSVTSGKNMIVAGDLNVELLHSNKTAKNEKVEGATTLFNDVELWEPGAMAMETFTVKNEGDLALKYQLSLDVEGDLVKALKVAVVETAPTTEDEALALEYAPLASFTKSGTLAPEANDTYTVVIYWEPSDNDNEYKSKDAAIYVRLVATQVEAENDSFGKDYDEGSYFDLQKDASGAYLISSATDLMAFNAEMNKDGLYGEWQRETFKLTADIDMAGYEWLSVNEMFLTFDGNGHTISNLTCIENGNKSGFFGYMGGGVIKNLTLKNVISVGSQAGIFAGQAEGADIINCNLEGTNFVAWDDDSNDPATKNGVGVYVGVSVESNETSGTIKSGTTTLVNNTGMSEAASGVWATNNKYVGGLYTKTQTVNIVDNGASVDSLLLYAEGLYQDTSKHYPTFYAVSAEGVANFANWRNSTNVTEGSPLAAYCYLLADVDMEGIEYTAFNGHFTMFDGNGHTIKNLNAKQGVSGKGGFVSYLGGGIIQNLTLEDASVNGCQVGLFAGQSEGGKVLNCFVKGENNKVQWAQNTTSDYVETWGGIGAIIGYNSSGTFDVEILSGAVVNLFGELTSEGTKVDDLTGYGAVNSGAVTNNGSVIWRTAVSTGNIKDAIANAKDGDTLILADNIDVGAGQLAIEKDVTIDLNGKTIAADFGYGIVSLKNGASIKNGTIDVKSNVAAIRAYNVGSIENVTINITPKATEKVATAIAVQQGGHVGTIKNVTITGATQGIEVAYQASVDSIENVNVQAVSNGSQNGNALVINGGSVGKVINSSFNGEVYGVRIHLKGVYNVGASFENCTLSGGTAALYAWDEQNNIANNANCSLTINYDEATQNQSGKIDWLFEEECLVVVKINGVTPTVTP